MQTPAITRAITRLVQSMPSTRAQRQEVRAQVIVFRTVPLNVRRTFEIYRNKSFCLLGRPTCTYHELTYPILAQAGPVQTADGHFCLLPVTVDYKGSALRKIDPLPHRGHKSRHATLKRLTNVAQAPHVHPLPDDFLASHLPPSLFSDDRCLRRCIQDIARTISQHAIIRVVVKGPPLLWGFCWAWAWRALHTFLAGQENCKETVTAQSILHSLQSEAQGNGWPVNSKQGWRYSTSYIRPNPAYTLNFCGPIAAASSLAIARSRLRVAPRAYTCFVRTLVAKLPAAVLVLSLSNKAAWVQQLNSWSLGCIDEADCKDEFNHIPPSLVIQHMKDATAWLKALRR